MREFQTLIIVVLIISHRRLAKLIVVEDIGLLRYLFNIKLQNTLVPLLSMLWVEYLQIILFNSDLVLTVSVTLLI